MSDCIFCKIVSGEISAEKVYEDEFTFAFLDINPNNFGHTLVLPKDHFRNIFDMPTEMLSPVYTTTQKIATALRNIGAEGVNIISNNEPAAGQLVFHAHIHVIPRYANDGFVHWAQKKYENTDAVYEMGEKIRGALK